MFNPLIEDLSHLKDDELTSKISELIKKYNMALKLGNGAVAQQIVVAVESYRAEQTKRQQEAAKQLLARQNKDLDGLINVG